MAAINNAAGIGYELVRSTWLIISVSAKFLLVAILSNMLYTGHTSLKSFDKKTRLYGKLTILTSGILSVPLMLAGTSYTPFFELFSQVIATGLLGYLFWIY